MISVIIPKYEDGLYLTRCLNAIKRQSYEDVEILVINSNCEQEIIDRYNLVVVEAEELECDGLNKAIALAKGEYIYFCNVSTVLSPNTLENLLQRDDEICEYVNIHVITGETSKQKDMWLSCYGKLFNKSCLVENDIKFSVDSVFSEILFVMEYITCLGQLVKRDDVYIYDTEPIEKCGGADVIIDIHSWRRVFQAIKYTDEELGKRLREELLKLIKGYRVCSEELAKLVEEEYHDDYELNYTCLEPVLKLLWSNVTQYNDTESLEHFREHIAKYEDENLMDLLLKACGVQKSSYEYIKNNDAKQCMFLIKQNNQLDTVQKQITDAVSSIMANPGSGLTKIGEIWYYYSNGKLDKTYRGMARNEHGWWYVSDGKYDKRFKGLCQNNGELWYIANGTQDKTFTGLAMNDAGIWMYVTRGKVDTEYVGLVKTKNGMKFISNGVIDKDYKGLHKTTEGKWVYIENGTINTEFIGLAQNDYGWWYVENGKVDLSYNGFAKNHRGWYEVVNGKAQINEQVDMIKIIEEKEKTTENIDLGNPVEISVGYYSNGQLGLGTIVKSIGAWGKYKFKR